MQSLLARYPLLADRLPLAPLDVRETPVEWWRVDDAALLVKRDDLSAPCCAGNKVRALAPLLGRIEPGCELLTVGPTGSTHALAVAEHGARLGVPTRVISWPQERHAVSDATARRLAAIAEVTPAGSVAEAYLRAGVERVRGRVHWVPAGGSVALGALGHVDAALELDDQVRRARLRPPAELVVPLGSGGTVAGLLVGLALAGAETRVVAVRVVPRLVANRWRVLGLARRTRALLKSLTGAAVPAVDPARLEIEEGAYGGAYARESPAGRRAAAALLDAGGPRLDPTYSAKAFGEALARARRAPDGRILFWLTFDARWLARGGGTTPATAPRPSPHSR